VEVIDGFRHQPGKCEPIHKPKSAKSSSAAIQLVQRLCHNPLRLLKQGRRVAFGNQLFLAID
jgi:hypothetical protein